MEKYIRLLNPKTTNFDAIGGGSHGSLTTQDVCLALSYANLNVLQDCLVRLKFFGMNQFHNIDQFISALVKKYESQVGDISSDHLFSIVELSLIEFCAVPASYVSSSRKREAITGISYMKFHRHLNKHVDLIIKDLNDEYALASEKVFFQLSITNL